MRKLWIVLLVCSVAIGAKAQKVLSEGIIRYQVTVTQGADKPGVADAFKGAVQTLYLRAYKAKVDFSSNVRSQSTVFDAQTGGGFILRQSGQDKYVIMLDKEKWQQYNKKFNGINYTYSDEGKQVAGYNCKKATGKLADGTEVVVYYTPELSTIARGYELAFAGINGIPLEYEFTSNGVTINYSALSIATTMVSAATFEIPKTGYKLLEYKQ